MGQTTVPQHDVTLVIPRREANVGGGAHVARLQMELKKLEVRCRARELAVERLSAALITLRNANRALREENSLLRLEVERRQIGNRSEDINAGTNSSVESRPNWVRGLRPN